MEKQQVSIRTRDLNLWYAGFHALKDVSIDVHPGVITALIGPSGCGKTSLLRCFNRLNERWAGVSTTGEICVLGKNIYDADVTLGELRKTVGMVFQRPNPLPLSIYDNVVFGLRIHGGRRRTDHEQLDDLVESALRSVALWDEVKDRLNEHAPTLTLEQQQKLCIARLLPLKPRVILMDEPCSALDAEGTAAIEQLVTDLKQDFTILMVTHNMAQARRISDECLFMLLGEVLEHASTANMFLNPARKETEAYVEGRFG